MQIIYTDSSTVSPNPTVSETRRWPIRKMWSVVAVKLAGQHPLWPGDQVCHWNEISHCWNYCSSQSQSRLAAHGHASLPGMHLHSCTYLFGWGGVPKAKLVVHSHPRQTYGQQENNTLSLWCPGLPVAIFFMSFIQFCFVTYCHNGHILWGRAIQGSYQKLPICIANLCTDSVEMSTSGGHVKNGLTALLIYVGIPHSCTPQGSLSNVTLFSKTFSTST